MAKESTLYQMLVEDLSEAKASRVLKGYGQRSAIIYREAETAAKDDSIHERLRPYYNGQLLFFLHQTMFFNLAEECNLNPVIVPCEQNGFPTIVVRVGRFRFTDHHGSNSHDVSCLNPSLMRSQNSMVNLSLVQPNLFDPPFDTRKLRKADDIYGNFIHGCHGPGKIFATHGFMQIAFPCAANVQNAEEARKKLRYVESFSLYTVLESVVARENQNRSTAQPHIRIVTPKIKKQQ